MHPSSNQTRRSIAIFSFALLVLIFSACEMRLQIPSSTNAPDIQAYEFEATGEDFLISALDEVQAIADWSRSFQNGFSAQLSDSPSAGLKTILSITSTDTMYIYGEIIPGGYGAVVTERYARPKGLLLITVRKTYGKGNGHVVTETKRYASYADHLGNNPQQTNVTEMYGTQADTIVAHVLRNGTLQTYTFRLPVITRVINPQDGSIRMTSRYASNGKILSRVTDGEGGLIQLRSNYGQSDGSTVTRTEYPDGSWSQVRTHGEADGTVTRETTSGLPTLGSGAISPSNIPRPVMSPWMPRGANGNLRSSDPGESIKDIPFLASGAMGPIGPVPRPRFARAGENNLLFFVSGQSMPGNMPRPIFTTRVVRTSHDDRGTISAKSIPTVIANASGNSTCPRPPLPIGQQMSSELPLLASGATMSCPKPPIPRTALIPCRTDGSRPLTTPGVASTSTEQSLASGMTMAPRPPRPILA